SEAYGFLFKLLCDPGDAVATPVPSYPLFEFLSTVESVAHYDYPLVYETGCWRLDEGGLLHSLRDGTRAIIAVHPNNPTGHFVKSEEFRTLRTACRERSLALICDEVFWDFSLAAAPKLDPAEETETLTFVLNGVSKLLGLPQLKLGWIVLRGPAALKKEARERLGFIADTFLSVSSPVQNALPRLMELRLPIQEQILRRLENNLKTLHRETVNSAVSVLTLEGGWTAILRLPFVLDDEDWALQLLERHNVVVHPGYFYGIPDSAHLVLSLLPEEAVFREGVRRIVLLSKEVAEA
ncbi:MAG TPA: pyridoxal phosphate-dependent aminotransferase, partial [Candidatus Krumholzibacterium sp.]|nr:pyridoxal phosphate-dependent aminotransferase [Candidatus Krumholzibacterium sp.]